MTTAPDPQAEGDCAPSADPLPAGVAQAFVDYANAEYARANGPVPYTLTPQAEEALDAAEPEEAELWKAYIDAAEAHDCPGPGCHPYPTFDDDPARWGFLPEPEMTEAEFEAAAVADAWGPSGPSASYAEWVADGRSVEPEAEL